MSSTDSLDNLAGLWDSYLRNVSKWHIQMQISISLLIQFIRCELRVFTTSKLGIDHFLADIERKGSECLVFWNDLDEILKVQQCCLESIFCNHLSLWWHAIPSLWIFRVSYDHFSRRSSRLRRSRKNNQSVFIVWERFWLEFQIL